MDPTGGMGVGWVLVWIVLYCALCIPWLGLVGLGFDFCSFSVYGWR